MTDAEWAAWRAAELERIRTDGERARQEILYGFLPGIVGVHVLAGLLIQSFIKVLDDRGY